MRTNLMACFLAAGYFTCLTMLDWKSRTACPVNLRHENKPSLEEDDQIEAADAYKVAVLLSIGAAILSLFA